MSRGGDARGQGKSNEAETLEYIRAMLRELRSLAKGERAEMLSYLIEMAYVEASDLLRNENADGERSQGSSRRETKPPE
jgi:hypothetical protein